MTTVHWLRYRIWSLFDDQFISCLTWTIKNTQLINIQACEYKLLFPSRFFAPHWNELCRILVYTNCAGMIFAFYELFNPKNFSILVTITTFYIKILTHHKMCMGSSHIIKSFILNNRNIVLNTKTGHNKDSAATM